MMLSLVKTWEQLLQLWEEMPNTATQEGCRSTTILVVILRKK
jgi:hypothetical protein